MAEELPLVTIVIPTKDDEGTIDACLACVLAQDYPRDRVEIVVADAMSMDATREKILRVAEAEPRVRLVDNPERTRAAALNVALRGSRGEIVVPMDPDGDYAKTHVSKCVDALAASSAEQLTIVPRSLGRTLRERALSAASAVELARGEDPGTALLGAVRRRVFGRVGLFDPRTKCEEDAELATRVQKAGGATAVRRDIVVRRPSATSFEDLFRRHYVLGASRARRAVKERRVDSLRELVPVAIVLGGGALAATSTVQPLTPIAGAAYALMTGAAAVRVGRREGLVTIPFAWAAFPVMHVARGIGFGVGVVRSLASPDWEEAPTFDEAHAEP